MTYAGVRFLEKYRANSLRPASDARIDSFQHVEDLRCMLMQQFNYTASSRSFANG